MNVVMMPSVAGGIGHISRTSALARALQRLDPSISIEYVLDCERLRPFNVEATQRMGFRPRLMPHRTRENRAAVVSACLGEADVIVEDTSRYLLPLRQMVPRAAWVSIPMHPIGDELFQDWPFMAQMDAIIWAYIPLVGLPEELGIVADKVRQTGPFLEVDAVPEKAEARAQLGIAPDEHLVVYAPRGFPFGREFGHRMLAGLHRGLAALRAAGRLKPRLILLAVSDPTDLQGVTGLPETLPDWVSVRGVVTPAESLLYARAADALIGEGTSTMHEGAGLRTPLVLVPGPIQEATLLANGLAKAGAAATLRIEEVTPERMGATFAAIWDEPEQRRAMTDKAHALVTGGGGVEAAARLVLEVAARHAGRMSGATR